MVSNAQHSVSSLWETVTQFLDISRFEAGLMPVEPTRGDLVDLASSVLQSLSPLARSRCEIVTPVPSIAATFDAELIRRVFGNLLGNALKYIAAHGQVKIRFDPADLEIRVAVEDDGPGIPPAYHEKIFAEFGLVEARNARSGSGLGLAFCKLAVQAHGGRIGLDSHVGQGSTFWFTLPLPPDALVAATIPFHA